MSTCAWYDPCLRLFFQRFKVDDRRLWSDAFSGSRLASSLLLAWRWIVFLFLFICILIVIDQDDAKDQQKHLAYLTYSSYHLAGMYFFSAAVIGSVACYKSRAGQTPYLESPLALDSSLRADQKKSCDWKIWLWSNFLRFNRVALYCSLPFETLVIILYWLVLYDAKNDSVSHDVEWWLKNGLYHILSCVLVILDFSVFSSNVLPAGGALITLCGTAVYLAINGIYTGAREPVYKILTWNDSFSAGMIIGSIIGLVVLYYLFAAIAQLRDFVCSHCCPRRHRIAKDETKCQFSADGWYPAIYSDGSTAAYPCRGCSAGCNKNVEPTGAPLTPHAHLGAAKEQQHSAIEMHQMPKPSVVPIEGGPGNYAATIQPSRGPRL